MKQVLQSLRDGTTELIDVPCPQVRSGHLLVATRVSLISAGTERMLRQFGQAGLLQKARQQPDKVRAVLEKVRTDGLFPTLEAVRGRLDEPVPMGYCNVGTVVEIGQGVGGFSIGDRVVSNGPHAEVVCVPAPLCARVADGVSDESAAFAVLSAVALQGIRLAEPTLGETFAVFGLGLVGQLAVQLLHAHGCRVVGLDFDAQRLKLAEACGARVIDLAACADPVEAAVRYTGGRGLDGVLIAAATQSNDPVRQAARMSRRRGRIVLVGVSGLELSRADFYEKELSFQVSCSYGPGRYDANYEQHGQDYPLPFVRWTAQRNFEAVLDLLAAGRLALDPLISHRFPFARAVDAYELIGSARPSLGVLLEYSSSSRSAVVRTIGTAPAAVLDGQAFASSPVGLSTAVGRWVPRRSWFASRRRAVGSHGPAGAFLGAGNFARRVLMPAFRQCGAGLEVVASRGGLSAMLAARRFGFREATTDLDRVFGNPRVEFVVIATRHDLHADLAVRALEAGKHVFLEKPLAIDRAQFDRVLAAYRAVASSPAGPRLMVGFNRRFAPHSRTMATLLSGLSVPKTFVVTVNAGAIARDHWTQDAAIGGGRIIGEACHYVDLLRFLCGAPIVAHRAAAAGFSADRPGPADDVTLCLQFADGSIGTLHYLSGGHRGFPKERIEVFAAGRVLQLDNFRQLRGWGWPQLRRDRLWRQDRGHRAEVQAFLGAIRTGRPTPIPFDEIVETTRLTLDVATALDGGAAAQPGPEAAHVSHGAVPAPHGFSTVKDDSSCPAS